MSRLGLSFEQNIPIGWRDSLHANQIYALPEPAIESASKTVQSTSTALFTASEVAAERGFASFCQSMHYAGTFGDGGIVYHGFVREAQPPDQETMRQFGFTKKAIALAPRAFKKADGARQRLLGVAGWLYTDLTFLKELAEIRKQWTVLPETERPSFPLARPVPTQNRPSGSVEAGPETSQFFSSLSGFLDRWGVMHLSTWDLPVAQGPLVPDLLPENAPARPRHGIRLFLPVHFPLHDADDLHAVILSLQQQMTADLGIAASFAGLRHHGYYARLFEVLHLERTFRSRFSNKKPKGIVGHIERAAAESFGIGVDQVKRIRKSISTCLKGKRDKIERLRPRF